MATGGRRVLIPLLAAALLLPAGSALAERIPSRVDDAGPVRAAALARVQAALAHPEVAEALAAQGLPVGEVEGRLARLSSEDLQRLAANIDQVQAAGSVPNYVWILLAAFLAVSTLAIIF